MLLLLLLMQRWIHTKTDNGLSQRQQLCFARCLHSVSFFMFTYLCVCVSEFVVGVFVFVLAAMLRSLSVSLCVLLHCFCACAVYAIRCICCDSSSAAATKRTITTNKVQKLDMQCNTIQCRQT